MFHFLSNMHECAALRLTDEPRLTSNLDWHMGAAAAAEHLKRFLATVAVEGQSIPSLGMEAVEVLSRDTERANARARVRVESELKKRKRYSARTRER